MSRHDAESLYLRQQYRGDVWHWCVPRWDLAEIMVCITHSNLIVKLLEQHANDSPPFPLDDAISAARQKWGDAPRDIIYALVDEDWLERNLRSALSRPNMNDFFRDICKAESFNINICPTATVVSTYRKDTILKKNAVTVEFTSPYIASRVQRALDTLWGVTRPEGSAFVIFAQERGEGVSFVGWAFERYCIDQLSNAGPSPFTVCGETTQVTSEIGTIYTCALQTPPTPSSLLSKLRSKLRGSSKLDPPAPTSLLPITFGYHVLDDRKLYLPEKSNFPLLDAFYVRLSGKRCTVVVLQFTNSTCHKGSPKGYDFLVSLKESFQLQLQNRFISDVPMDKKRRRIREVGFEYRLVVPLSSTSDSDAPTRSVSWHMPADMPEAIKGPVFVQFLPVELPVIDRVEDESSFVINKQIEA
ncbi:hypothetical protein ONZ45_g7956 [Pleurotus djamor]|nr:hypothetical protein ONZ45_g7956 [Pleurotus djamor]